MRTPVRDCLLRLCGRIIVGEGSVSREDIQEWLEDVFGKRQVLLHTMTLELNARRPVAPVTSGATGSLHIDGIRPVCEAHPFVSVTAETLDALRDDEHRFQCAGARRHRLPADEPVSEAVEDEPINVDEEIAIAPAIVAPVLLPSPPVRISEPSTAAA